MSPLASMLTPNERAGLKEIAAVCGDRLRPLALAPVSKTCAKSLAKLELVALRNGRIDKALLAKITPLGMTVLGELNLATSP